MSMFDILGSELTAEGYENVFDKEMAGSNIISKKCVECATVSSRKESFLSLSLHIPQVDPKVKVIVKCIIQELKEYSLHPSKILG
jgi:hypothetical protein